jgi:hypothetical protein
MSYPGDPAGGQQPAYPYSDGQGAYQPQANPSPFGAPQPQSGPPAPGQPYSGAPAFGSEPAPSYGSGYYDPNAPGAPTSGAYGPAMSTPVSGPGAPIGGPGAPAGSRRAPTTAIFASLMVVFLLATAVLTVLYVTKNGDYNEQKKTSAERQQNINALNGEVQKTKDELAKTQEELATTKRDLGGSQAQADELKRQKAVISKCITLLGEASEAAEAGNAALAQQKQAEAEPICNEAGRYLD